MPMTPHDDFCFRRMNEHFSLHGFPRWTMQRAGRAQEGKYRWRIFCDRRPVAITDEHVSFEAALVIATRCAQMYLDGERGGVG